MTTLGTKTAPRPCALSNSGSSSSNDAELDDGTVDNGEGLFGIVKVDWGLGEASAENID